MSGCTSFYFRHYTYFFVCFFIANEFEWKFVHYCYESMCTFRRFFDPWINTLHVHPCKPFFAHGFHDVLFVGIYIYIYSSILKNDGFKIRNNCVRYWRIYQKQNNIIIILWYTLRKNVENILLNVRSYV